MTMRCPAFSKAGTLGLKSSISFDRLTTTVPSWRKTPHLISSSSSRAPAVTQQTRHFSSINHSHPAKSDEQRRKEDRQDIVVSVLRSSATRRDAKNYLRKYAPQSSPKKQPQASGKGASLPPSAWTTDAPVRAASQAPQFYQGQQPESHLPDGDPLNLAVVKLRLPQTVSDEALSGITKTLSQLRKLGLQNLVVLDAGHGASRMLYWEQAHRIQQALDQFGKPASRIAYRAFTKRSATQDEEFLPASVMVNMPQFLVNPLREEQVLIVPPVTLSSDFEASEVVDPDEALMALTKYFCGLQQALPEEEREGDEEGGVLASGFPGNVASIERVIIIDPIGGTPLEGDPEGCHRFINLEQEYDSIMDGLKSPIETAQMPTGRDQEAHIIHGQNLKLAKDILSLLPSTSTALISTPAAAATKPTETLTSVSTRNRLNPLIHNLLTDKPVFSSSLPMEKVRADNLDQIPLSEGRVVTMVKRGMPLTIFPDPTKTRWFPPKAGEPRLKLTDTCIDLPRLQYLIEDSFDRKLDLQHYLDRVNENLAGVIIAGEYEGGAILTWEKPAGAADDDTKRLVPYLDKFAVLKSRQGSGGVADVVFNAMVRGCFPDGVCWRSRMDNPVNKWYFERSLGTHKVKDTNWTMFWTTPHLPASSTTWKDYEDVCRRVEPSWADKKRAAD